MKYGLEIEGVKGFHLTAKPFGDSPVAREEGAWEEIVLKTTEGIEITFRAGSYIIPEEACIYVEAKKAS